MEKYMKNIRKYLPAAAIAAALLWLFYEIYPVIFATHDDMRTYLVTRNHTVFRLAWEQAICGRISHLWNTLLLSIPFLAGKVWFYKAFAYGCFIFDLAAARLLLKQHVGKDFANCTVLLIISWACLTNYHNMLVSYALCHQLPIAFLFISLYYFGNSLQEPRRKNIVRSAVFLLLACMIYEAFMASILLFAFWSLMHESEKEPDCGYFVYLRNASRRLLLHLAMLGGYMIVYYGWRHFFPTIYDGTELTLYDPFMSLLTMLFYSVAFFPITEMMDYTRHSAVPLRSIVAHIAPAAWAVSALTAAAFAVMLPRIRISRRKLYIISVLSGIGTLVPVMVISFTPKYPGWVRLGAIGYLPSYYSYFFLIIFIIAGMIRVYQALPDQHHRRTVSIILTAAVFCTSLTANAVTAIWRPFFDMYSLRYRNFDHVVSGEQVTSLTTGWQIYAPDNGGIHNDRGLTEMYLQLYNPEQVDYLTNMEQLSAEKQTFCMRMPENCIFAVTGAADGDLCADTVTVQTLVPDALEVILYDADGNEVRFENVHDGDILHAPENTAFNFCIRPTGGSQPA